MKGNVELWMLDIEQSMIDCLKKLGTDALESYPVTQRTEWSKMYPGQIVLAISQIFWTTEVEKAIQDCMLEEYWKVQQNQIE
jgi:dynein heavy chain